MKKFWAWSGEAVNQLRTLLDAASRSPADGLDGQLLPTFYQYVTRRTISDGSTTSVSASRAKACGSSPVICRLTFEEGVKDHWNREGRGSRRAVGGHPLVSEDEILSLTPVMTMENGNVVFQSRTFTSKGSPGSSLAVDYALQTVSSEADS